MERALKERQEIGAFYTPPQLAMVMSKWAIRDSSDDVLEPSFGGCCFLQATWSRLRDIGCKRPILQLYGADIDEKAFRYLRDSFQIKCIEQRFLKADFLLLTRTSFSSRRFTTIIGNPPFVPGAKLPSFQRERYQLISRASGFDIPRKAGLWVYFVLCSIQYLKLQGRMAWILPTSLLKTKHGLYMQLCLSRQFKSIRIIPIEQPLFTTEGTRTLTSIVLADDFNPQQKRISKPLIDYCSKIEEVEQLLEVAEATKKKVRRKKSSRDVLKTILEELSSRKEMHALKDIADVHIGIVTGDSKRFVVQKEVVKQLKLKPSYTQECLLKGGYCDGLQFGKDDFKLLIKESKPCYLLTVPASRSLDKDLRGYLYKGLSKDRIEQTKTFKKRSPWYSIERTNAPDGFFQFFHGVSPRFIINNAGVVATNSLYVLNLLDKKNRDKHLMCIALIVISSLGQAYSELCATRFGSGSLKLDVADVKSIPLPIHNRAYYTHAELALKKADLALRCGDRALATAIADKWLMRRPWLRPYVEAVKPILAQCKKTRLGLQD